jgi:hypothetical protein
MQAGTSLNLARASAYAGFCFGSQLCVDLRDGLTDELSRRVTQMPGTVSSRDQDSQCRFGDDDHGSTPVIS